jgi:tRNA modification GTPase
VDLELEELTPPGRGAVSVLRVRGSDAVRLLRDLGAAEVAAGTARLARLRLGGEDLDEAIVCRRPDGDLELHLHGSPVLLARLARSLGSSLAARPATDLESLAAAELARAPAESAARILLDQAEGALARELRSLAAADARAREARIGTLLERWRIARRALRPAEVVLAGAVNAGKSTLFNALLGEARAIVDPEPGTTRDVIRERASFGAYPVWVVDTAGERALGGDGDDVEREGQARGSRAREAADLVLRLEPVPPRSDASRPVSGERAIVVRTFADRCPDPALASGAISALRDPAEARARVADLYRRTFALPEDPWSPGTAVPFTQPLAAAIAGLGGASGPELERRVGSVLDLSFAPRASPS